MFHRYIEWLLEATGEDKYLTSIIMYMTFVAGLGILALIIDIIFKG